MKNPIYSNLHFDHMLPQDQEVFKLFLASPANIYEYFDYDVRVGDGRDPGTEHDENTRQLAIKLSQRRIDAVGHHADHIAIIEVTRVAGLKALGQLHAYPVLYQLKYKPQLSLKPILIAETLETDAEEAFHFAKIPILLYKVPKTS